MSGYSYVASDWIATASESVESLVPKALKYARQIGTSSLGRSTFHDRARMVLRMADYLSQRSDSLYHLSAQVGATRRDAASDIDGALALMVGLARVALKELPDASEVLDGPPEHLTPDEDLAAQHLYVSPGGVAVMLNAFSLLLRGSAARLVPAFLAGVPMIIKPAPQTAPVAVELTRLIAQSRVMPKGALQLLNGRTETFWDYLRGGDRVYFTGSSRTALKLARQPKVVSGRVELSVAAESVNAAILGPDWGPGSPGFRALIGCVATEMTTRAGQTCTAIRRVLVPRESLNAFVDGLCQYLDETVVLGDPADPATTVGPLIDHAQLRHLNRQVKELVAFGGRVVRGGAKPRRLTGPYFEPTVLAFAQPSPVFSDVEPFGPVVSVGSYTSRAEAIRLANDDAGSTVITLASGDLAFRREVIAGLASWHRRIRLLDEFSQEPMPAQRGEGHELAGVRSILSWMRRVAIEGSESQLAQLAAYDKAVRVSR
ncbi:MAG: aldehyde dehydrogenase family protein [Bifidobacteriaceae bacterium]|jgi:oxepin-CoA hydrolase/3-oxo-5,6-dehydrosuberyl-CoA semialdehyde dehydrogenase|nr:aldehyde dehydrogenase family protein [Bifidobacteriaceae bacterium]